MNNKLIILFNRIISIIVICLLSFLVTSCVNTPSTYKLSFEYEDLTKETIIVEVKLGEKILETDIPKIEVKTGYRGYWIIKGDETNNQVDFSLIKENTTFIIHYDLLNDPVLLTKEMFNSLNEYLYTNEEIKPEITSNIGLIKDLDYTYYYEDNINIGTGYVCITGINNYTGTIRLPFKIVSNEKMYPTTIFAFPYKFITTGTHGGNFFMSNTYSSSPTYANQITSKNKMTISIAGETGKIEEIALMIKTNTSKGIGSVNIQINNTSFSQSINIGRGYTKMSTTYYEIIIKGEANIKDESDPISIIIEASENSIYCNQVTINPHGELYNDDELVKMDLDEIGLPSYLYPNQTLINLPSKGKNGSIITWKSSNDELINPLTGDVIHPNDKNTIIEITGEACLNETYKYIRTYKINVYKLMTESELNHSSYYKDIVNLTNDSLKLALRKLISQTTKVVNYDELKDILSITDEDPNNSDNMILFYSNVSIKKTNNMDFWDREHVWCQSLGWFSTTGAGADPHHLRPTNKNVNSSRGNKPFNKVDLTLASKIFYGGSTGTKTIIAGYANETWFEPNDNVKGDVARIIFYLKVRYSEADNYDFKSICSSMDLLLTWNELDPVSNSERYRNQKIYEIQGNLNPFIDNPQYANLIWQP